MVCVVAHFLIAFVLNANTGIYHWVLLLMQYNNMSHNIVVIELLTRKKERLTAAFNELLLRMCIKRHDYSIQQSNWLFLFWRIKKSNTENFLNMACKSDIVILNPGKPAVAVIKAADEVCRFDFCLTGFFHKMI